MTYFYRNYAKNIMINIDSAEAKKNFKEWVKEFLSSTMRVKPSDVWTLDLIAETIAMKYDMDMDVILENK